jgi:transposase
MRALPHHHALMEGKNNRVNVLKRRAYGYRNDTSLPLKILSLTHAD